MQPKINGVVADDRTINTVRVIMIIF